MMKIRLMLYLQELIKEPQITHQYQQLQYHQHQQQQA